MVKDLFTETLHQLLLMSRDPVLYLAIDEENSGFSKDEVLAIQVAKASALYGIYELDRAMDLALKLNATLKDKDILSLEILNLLTVISIYGKKGDRLAQKSYIDEVYIRGRSCKNQDVKLMASCLYIINEHHDSQQMEPNVQKISEQVYMVEHPYVRFSLLAWLGKIYKMMHQYDQALNFYSAAYDVSSTHQMSICSLKLSLSLISACARLQRQKNAEHFYEIGNRLIAQLRIPIYEIEINHNYALLKSSLDDHQAAVHFYQKSLEALEASELELPLMLFEMYNNLANSLNILDQSKEALAYQLKAEEIIQGKELARMEISLSENIAVSMIAQERWGEAIQRLRKAVDYYKENDMIAELVKTLRSMAYYYRQKRDYKKECGILRELDGYSQSLITKLQQSHSQYSDRKLHKIIEDSKSLRSKYDQLMSDIVRRQSTRFIGNSKAAKRVIDSAVFASMHREANVLILGESGTGKEVLAQMIHYSSPQKNEPFIPVNCTAISASLFGVEFFGAAAGDFTGASEDRKGFFEMAENGTIFIDEISNLPLDFQARLIRTIDTKRFSPVGSDKSLPLNCKILSSTKHDSLELLESQRFRIDLMHRLNTLEIEIPPLRDRLEDIPLLVDSFCRTFARETNRRLPQIRDSFYARLGEYRFPGNARELKNIVERIFILYFEPVWTSDILDNIGAFKRDRKLTGSLIERNIQDIDRDRIIEALSKTGGRQKTAAKLLNMSESTLSRKIKRYKIK